MDLKSMKRKELQALCKEHGLPANSTNSQMIESLSSIFQEKIKPKGCLKGSGGSISEDLGILRGGAKKVSFVIEDEEEVDFEEFTVKPVGNSKRKSVGRRSSVAPELVKRSKDTEKDSQSESLKDATEVPRRTTRSSGLAEAVLWSPVVEKKKKSGDGTEGVRQNATNKEKGIFGEVPVTRSLRNRAVVVGGDEVSVTDRNLRRTQKRKNSDKKEENEKAVTVLVEDEAVGRKNLRKRSREGDSMEDEPLPRRSGRAKSEETVATEEIDIERSKKRRKGAMETSLIEKVVADDTERTSKPGGNAKRSRGNVLDGNAMGSRDVNDGSGQKKARSQQNNHASTQGDSTDSISDGEAVTGPTRRSTRSSSALLEVGNSVFAVGKSDQEGETVRKSKSRKQMKGRASKGAESASLLQHSEVLIEPVKRSTRASSTLLEDGTSKPVGGKSAEGGEVVRKGKSLKQANDHNSKGESTFSMLDNEVVTEIVRRSTHSSSTLLLDGTSLPVVGKSVEGGEVVRKGKSQKQVKDVGSKGGSTTSLPDSEVAAEPLRRSTRSSSTMLEDGTSLPVVGKLVKGGKVDGNGKSQKQVKNDGAKGGVSTTSLPDHEVVAEPPRRSIHSSSTLLEDATSLPVVGKSVKGGEAIRKGKSPKQANDHASGGGVSTASLSDNEVVAESTRRLTHSSSKLLEDESAVGKSGGPGKRQKGCASKQGDLTTSLPDTETVTTPTRRLTHSSSKCFGNETVSPVVGKLCDTVSQENSCEQPRDHASGRPLLDDRVVTTPTWRSTQSSSMLLEDETLLKTETLVNGNEVRKDTSVKHSKKCALKLEGSTAPVLHNEDLMTPARRSTRSSSKLLEDGILPEIGKLINENDAIIRKDKSGKKSKNSALKPEEIVGGCGSRGAMEVGSISSRRKSSRKAPVDSEVMQRQCSPGPASSLLEDIQNNSYVESKSSGKKQSNIKQSSQMLEREVDVRRTSIGCHTLEEQDILSDNKVAASKSTAAIGAADEISLPGSPTAALSFSLSIAVESTSGETEFSNDVDDKIISEIRQSPANVQFQKIDSTSFVGALKDLDDLCLGSDTKEKQSSFMEISIKGKGELPLNITEGSSEIQENVSRKVDTTLEAEGTLESYGDDSSKAQAPLEGELPLNITDSSSEIQENVLRKVDTTLEAEGTLESYGDDSGKALAPVDPTFTTSVNSGETSVGVLDDVDGLTGMESQNFTSQPVSLDSLLSSEELSTIFHTEISAMAHLKESDSAEEVDVVREDIMTDYGARHIMTPRFPHSSEEPSLASDTEASPGLAHEEANLEVEICSAAEDGLAGNIATDISGPMSVCKRYEEPSPTLNTDASPEVDFEEPESKVKVDGPSEDVVACSGAAKIIDPVTSAIEVFPEAHCDTNVEKSDSEVEVHVAYKGGMEGIEATVTAVSPFSCKSGEVLSPTLLPTLLNEVSPNIDLREPDLKVETHAMASCSNDFLSEASATSSKTFEVLVTANRDAGDSSHIQRIFDNEMETCKADPDNILNAQLASGACDARKILEASAGNSDSQLEVIKETWVSSTSSVTVNDDIETEDGTHDVEKNEYDSDSQLEVIKETWVSSTLSVTVNDVIGTEDGTNVVEKNEDELRPSSLSDYPAFDAGYIPTCGVIETPRMLGCEGSTKQVGIQDFPYVPDSEDSRHLSDQHGGVHNVTESLGVDSVDRSPNSAPNEHEALEQLNGIADILPENANTVNELTNVEFEEGLELGAVDAVDAEDMKNIESLESEASIDSDNGTVTKKEHTIELDKFDHFDEVGQTRDEVFFLQEVKGSSGELHTDDSVDRSPNSPPKEHEALEQLNGIADILPENANTVNELTNVEFEKGLELGAVDAEEMKNIESLESEASIEGDNDTVTKKEDTIELDKFDHFDEVGQTRDEVFFLQEVKGSSGELHTDDSVDRSPNSPPKEHKALEQLNGIADILPETANTANELTDVEFEKGLELGAVDAEKIENIDSLENEASIEGDNDTVTKKEDTIELDKFDHFDEVGQTRDEVFFLQEVKGSSGELHTDDTHSHPSLENSASMSGEVRFPSLENFSSSTYMGNAPTPSLPKMDAISSVEGLLNKDNTEKASAEEEILNNEEFLSPVSFSLLANRQESQDSAMLKKNTSSGGSLGLAASPGTNLADSHKVGGKSKDGKEVGAKMELILLCNVHEELDNEKGQLAALTQSNEEERAHTSPIKFESVPEAREEHSQLSTSKSTYLIPVDTFKCEDYNTRTVCVTALSEPGSVDADNTNNDNDLLEENSDYNAIITSPKLAEAEHGVDHSINMSVSGMAQDSVVTGISENSKAEPAGDQSLVKERLAKVVADSSTKSQTQGTLECFEQGSNVEKAWVAPGPTLMFVEDVLHMDSEVASFVNDGAQVGRVGHHEENLAHGKCENLLEVNTAETLATEEPEFKAIAASGSSDAKSQEASPFECEMSPMAENFSGGSAKPCAGMDSQASLVFSNTEQSEGQEERRIFIQETSEVSKLTKDELFIVLDGIKTEGSSTVVSKSDTTEITPIPKAAKQEELIARNCTELPGTNAAHHVVLWDWKESLGTERRPIGNELVESKFSVTSAQHAMVSLESGVVGGNSSAVQEESISKDEIMAHEYFGDFGWAFADDIDVGCSHHEVQDVDSQLPTESAQGNSADHSSKCGIDMNEEQNKSSELDQIEDSKECVQSTPMRLDINVRPCSVIDDVIRNKENTLGLKMDSALRHNEKSKISNSSRRPLQSVRKFKDEH